MDPCRRTTPAVVIHEPIGLDLTVWQLLQQRARRALHRVDSLAEAGRDRPFAEPIDQFTDPALAERAGGALCPEVRNRRKWVADVLRQQVEDVAIVLPVVGTAGSAAG